MGASCTPRPLLQLLCLWSWYICVRKQNSSPPHAEVDEEINQHLYRINSLSSVRVVIFRQGAHRVIAHQGLIFLGRKRQALQNQQKHHFFSSRAQILSILELLRECPRHSDLLGFDSSLVQSPLTLLFPWLLSTPCTLGRGLLLKDFLSVVSSSSVEFQCAHFWEVTW